MENVSVTVPNNAAALAAASEFLTALAKVSEGATETTASKPWGDPAADPVADIQKAKHSADVEAFIAAGEEKGDGEADAGAAAGTPPSPGAELDADGLPWDGRIHASSKTKLAKTKQWKKKRGVAPEVVAQVEAELRQVMAIPATTTEAAAPTPPATTEAAAPTPPATTEAAAPTPPATTEAAAPTPPATTEAAAPTPPTPPATTEAAAPTLDFATLMQRVTAKGLTPEQVSEKLAPLGVPSVALLATRPDLLPAAAAVLEVEA